MEDKQENRGDTDRDEPKEKLSPWAVISSVFAAGFGVQSSRNRERDFKQGKFGIFVAAGIIFTLLFIGIVFLVVQMVLKSAGH